MGSPVSRPRQARAPLAPQRFLTSIWPHNRALPVEPCDGFLNVKSAHFDGRVLIVRRQAIQIVIERGLFPDHYGRVKIKFHGFDPGARADLHPGRLIADHTPNRGYV